MNRLDAQELGKRRSHTAEINAIQANLAAKGISSQTIKGHSPIFAGRCPCIRATFAKVCAATGAVRN